MMLLFCRSEHFKDKKKRCNVHTNIKTWCLQEKFIMFNFECCHHITNSKYFYYLTKRNNMKWRVCHWLTGWEKILIKIHTHSIKMRLMTIFFNMIAWLTGSNVIKIHRVFIATPSTFAFLFGIVISWLLL